MKVKITKYPSDLFPIQRLEQKYNYLRVGKRWMDEDEMTPFDRKMEEVFDFLTDITRPVNRFWSKLFPRKIQVRVDSHDIWNADNTLAHIILPVLKELREHKQGYSNVDVEDVPEGVKDQEAWYYVLDEMIWAFDKIIDDDWDSQFHHHLDNQEWIWTPADTGAKGKVFTLDTKVKDESKPAYWFDREGYDAFNKRIQNGLNLFGKYYRGLWT